MLSHLIMNLCVQTGITKGNKNRNRNGKKVRRKMTAAEREAKMRQLELDGFQGTLDDYYDQEDGKF